MGLVSIIIPAYNVEKYIERCLESVKKQSYKNIEVLIIDDGSTDNTGNIAINFCKTTTNFKYFKKNNEGVSSARNLGLDKSNGEYISFVDSDDTIEPSFIEKLVLNIKEEDSFCIVNGMYKVIDNKKVEYLIKKESIPLLKNPSCCLRLYKKSDIDKLKLRFEPGTMGEDLEFVAKLLFYNNNYTVVEEFLYNYYMNDSSLTHTYTDHVYSVVDAIDRIENYTKQISKYEKYYSVLEYINICHILLALMKNASKAKKFNNYDIDKIIDIVVNKYPKCFENANIRLLKPDEQAYLKNLKLRNYNEIKKYLSKF